MARAYQVYDLATRTGEAVHETATSSGTGNKQTITKPPQAAAMYLQAETNNARVTFDGTDPVAGTTGLILYAGAAAQIFLFASDVEFVSEIAGNSKVNVTWLE